MLLSEPEIKRLGENAEKFYFENLSVKVGVDRFADVFNEVIEIERR
jgi:hypothetical protein